MNPPKRIIILGAGFAGLKLAQKLNNTPYDVLLINRQNYHQFQPLLYQVATARLEPTSISFPLRKVFQHSKNVRIRIAEILNINIQEKYVATSVGNYSYDYLVVAYGCTTNYFGNKKIEEFALPMKSVSESLQLRNHILQTFEDALVASPSELESLYNFVIVGGGPTGVELAGALVEMKEHVLPKDYPEKDFAKLTIYLVEGSPNTLNAMSDFAKKASEKYLRDMNIIVVKNTYVIDFDGRKATLNNGETLPTQNLIWTAGVTGNTIEGFPKEVMTKGNRLLVNQFHEVQNLSDVFAIGDIALMPTKEYPIGHPQLAGVANAQAVNLAKNFKQIHKNKKKIIYEYRDRGAMATIGKRKAIIDLPKLKFKGRFAWFFWMFLHLMLILSIKNRLIIFLNWMMSYFYNDSTLRVILYPRIKRNY